MKKQSKTKKPRNPNDAHLRTEVAIKKAVRLWGKNKAYSTRSFFGNAFELEFYIVGGSGPIAIADLRDLYRKRAPLKGVMRKMRKAVQPKRRGAGK